ncbi:hypothetical protein HMPREF1248_0981 [Coriobacteriaceae bacterium BV3Ac1]|nr:hypothetical protein HMPREF1248_0981 [Coriobacteriaceae bacterium BV3Ac1]
MEPYQVVHARVHTAALQTCNLALDRIEVHVDLTHLYAPFTGDGIRSYLPHLGRPRGGLIDHAHRNVQALELGQKVLVAPDTRCLSTEDVGPCGNFAHQAHVRFPKGLLALELIHVQHHVGRPDHVVGGCAHSASSAPQRR